MASAAYLLCFAVVVVWGVTFTLTKQLLVEMPPMQILAVRFLLGYGALWVLVPRRLAWQGLGEEWRMALAGVLGVTLYFMLENLALAHGGAGMVSVFVCTSPVLTALLPHLVGHGKRLRFGYWCGFLLAVAGLVLTLVREGGVEIPWQAAGLALLGACAWALYTLLPLRLPPRGGKEALLATRRMFFWGLVSMAPLCFLEPARWSVQPLMEGHNFWRLLALGCVAGACGYAAWNICVARLGSLRAALFLYIVPVAGVLTASLFLGEVLTGRVLLGVVLTLAGVALSSFSARKA